MNDTLKAITEFVGKAIQWLITIAIIVILVGYAGNGRFTPEQLWQLVVGIFIFWFGDRILQKYILKNDTEAPASKAPPKASSGVNPLYTPPTASSAEDWPVYDDKVEDDGTKSLDEHYKAVVDSIEEDGLDVDNASMSSRMYSYLANHESEFSDADKDEWIADGVDKSSDAFEEVAGIDAPESWEEAADYNKWWREHSVGCKVNKSTAKPLFMTCRSWLKLMDTGEW